MTERTDITAAPMIAWPAPSPSSPEPHSGAPRGAGLDGSARPSTVAGRAVNASSVDVPKRKSTFTEISYTNVLTLPLRARQLIAETRVPIPMKPGRAARVDYGYERN